MEAERLSPGSERLVAGKVIEEAKRNDEELVIARDGKPVRIKAREL